MKGRVNRRRDVAKDLPEKKRDIRIWKFVLSYILLMGVFVILIGYEPVKSVMDINGAYTRMIVYFSYLALKPFGIVQGIDGSVITLKGLALDVRFGCNGLEAFLIYSIAVLAFPARWILKTLGVVIGFIVLQIVNILRIAGLGLTGIYLPQYFQYVHIYVAQGMMIAVAFVLFLFWVGYASKK
jgi:exosortase/archaeosortase family protein